MMNYGNMNELLLFFYVNILSRMQMVKYNWLEHHY
jgi:hypothetical protein